jgi:hypothetical protein
MAMSGQASAGTPRFVTRWDLDRTYLRSRFDTLSELFASALEKVEEKRTVPGATAVLRELGHAGGRVHILSGSPRQMRKKLSQKLALDGVSWDELTLKPNLQNLLHLRLDALRDQLGYKLPELLEARLAEERRFGRGAITREVLVGDDSESDAFVYSLYADLCAGKLSSSELLRVLAAGATRDPIVLRCQAALAELPRAVTIDSILIHLDAQSPPSVFSRFGTRVIPFYNYLQAALVLLERNFLDGPSVIRIAREFVAVHGFAGDAVGRSYLDLLRRGHATGTAPALLEPALLAARDGLTPELFAELDGALSAMRRVPDDIEAHSRPAQVDYAELARLHRGGKNRRRLGQRW